MDFFQLNRNGYSIAERDNASDKYTICEVDDEGRRNPRLYGNVDSGGNERNADGLFS